MQERFKIRVTETIHKFVGHEIIRDVPNRLIYLSMFEYTEKIIRFFRIEDDDLYPPLRIPMQPGIRYSKNDCPTDPIEIEKMKEIPYMIGIGMLRYLADNTRYDIQVSLGILSQFSTNPAMIHWLGLIDIGRYLKFSRRHCLVLGRRSLDIDMNTKYTINAWPDASFANEFDRTSRSGGAVFMDLSVITAYSRKQRMVVLDTMSSEIVSMKEILKEVQYNYDFFNELGIPTELPIPVYEDNKATKSVCINPGSKKSKHMETYISHIRQFIEEGIIEVLDIESKLQKADILTKPLRIEDFELQRDMLGIVNLPYSPVSA